MANQYDNDLSEQQMKFVDAYLDHGHITKAALQAGYAKTSAHVQGSRLLKNDKIVDYIAVRRQERKDAVHLQLASYAEEAIQELYKLMKDADSENVKMQAIKDIMDRAGYKPVEKQETKNDTKIEFGFRDPNEDE
jgi:phage terminase small subunit